LSEAARTLDFGRPVAIILTAILHLIQDDEWSGCPSGARPMAIDAKGPAQMWAGVAFKPAFKPALKPALMP